MSAPLSDVVPPDETPIDPPPPPPPPPPPSYSFTTSFRQVLEDPTPVANRQLGISVGSSDDGNTLVAGTNGAGVVLYSFNGTNYQYSARITRAGTTGFGRQATLSGDGLTLFIGANNAVFMYKRTTATDTVWAEADFVGGSTSIGTFAISTDFAGTRFVTQDGTAVRAYENIGYWRSSDSRSNSPSRGGSSRMSSNGEYYIVNTFAGAKVYQFGGGEVANFAHSSARGGAISGDGLTVSVTVYGDGVGSGTSIYTRPDTSSPFVAYANNPIRTLASYNGESDSLSNDGTIMTVSSDSEFAQIWEKSNGLYARTRNFSETNENYGYASKLARSGSVLVVGAYAGFGGASQAGKLYAYRSSIKP